MDSAPSAANLSRTLIYMGTDTDMMPLVNKPNPAMCLLAACQCVGRICPRRATCKMIHDMDITKWPAATFTKWSDLIDQTPTMEWNRKVVDLAKTTLRNTKLATSSLTGASATKQDKL
jgi:hypothetical protein